MRIGTFDVNGEQHVVVEIEGKRIDLALSQQQIGAHEPWTRDLNAWLQLPDRIQQVERLLERTHGGAPLPAGARQLAPLPRPHRNVLCVGRNYGEHIAEGGRAYNERRVPSEVPIFFTKAPETVVGPDEAIESHAAITERMDYEAELAVVIGQTCRDVRVDEARRVVAGYTLLNDVTARDVQRQHQQWFKGKSLDRSCPLGPWLVTADAFGDWPFVTITTTVNGEERQRFNTADMLFPIPHIIAQLSRGFTLLPGDIIATGTGSGCGFAMDPPRFLQAGDEIIIHCEEVGTLRNTVA